jgi:hypothetical protein
MHQRLVVCQSRHRGAFLSSCSLILLSVLAVCCLIPTWPRSPFTRQSCRRSKPLTTLCGLFKPFRPRYLLPSQHSLPISQVNPSKLLAFSLLTNDSHAYRVSLCTHVRQGDVSHSTYVVCLYRARCGSAGVEALLRRGRVLATVSQGWRFSLTE